MRTLICLILTLACAFGSYQSFMSKDYVPLKQWLSYYQEYKEIQAALAKGTESKAELLAKLEKMYPQHAAEIEAKFKEKYGDLKDAQNSLREKWSLYSEEKENERPRREAPTRPQPPSQNRRPNYDASDKPQQPHHADRQAPAQTDRHHQQDTNIQHHEQYQTYEIDTE